MDELDVNLLDAWGRVVEELRGDRGLARARWRRSRGAMLRRPPRAWCLSLRASDTRIGPWNADPCAARGEADRVGHGVELDGRAVRALCAPVVLRWPGVKLVEAAARLGRHPEALRHWLPAGARPGRTRRERARKAVRCYEEVCEPGGIFSVSYERARCHGHQGVDVPVVWSDRPLNPGASRGEGPHALWGTMWQALCGDVPDEYVLRVERVPRVRPYGGGERFRGWDYVCPGRFDPLTGGHRACGRRVQTLYCPLPVFTIGNWLGDDGGIEVGEVFEGGGGEEEKSAKPQAAGESAGWGAAGDEMWGERGKSAEPQAAEGESAGWELRGGFRGRLSGRWYPGLEDAWRGRRGFACSACWGVRNFSLCDYRGWNEFVSYISGGLLYGREVVRPGWLGYERKRVGKRVGEEEMRGKSAKPRAAEGGGGVRVAIGEVGG